MFVPVVVPAHRGSTTVINKTIIYSDTVLSLKEKGRDLQVTSVNVSKYAFENCMKTILEANPDVIFNTIQYSCEQEKAIFYTDKPISTKSWEKRFEENREYLKESSNVSNHIQELLYSERIFNPECIAVYDILQLVRKSRIRKKEFEENIEGKINSKLKRINNDYYVSIYDMDYKTLETSICVCRCRRHSSNDRETFCFKKNENDIYISKRDGNRIFGDEILGIIGKEIKELYEYQLGIKDEVKQFNYRIKSVNSYFLINFGWYGVKIYIGESLTPSFSVEMYSYSDEVGYVCNSEFLMSWIKKNEKNLYKKIFVKIDDCSTWMRDELQQIRNEQLIKEEKERRVREQKRIKEEYKKLKKQERREFWRKILPFIK